MPEKGSFIQFKIIREVKKRKRGEGTFQKNKKE